MWAQRCAGNCLPTYHSTVAPKLTSRRGGELARRAERGDGTRSRRSRCAPSFSARPPQHPEPRGAVGHPHSAPGMWHACVSQPRDGPPHRTQLHTDVVGQSGVSGETNVASQQRAPPSSVAPQITRSSRRLSAGSTCGAVVWASHCCGTTCPSGPTASKQTCAGLSKLREALAQGGEARRPNPPSTPLALSVSQTASLVPQAHPGARRRLALGLPPAAGLRQGAWPVCSRPHHRACGHTGPRRVVGWCAGHGWREAQRKVREATMRIADPGGGVVGPKGPVPRTAASLPRRERMLGALWARPGPTVRARAKACRRATHQALARLCLAAAGRHCGCKLAFCPCSRLCHSRAPPSRPPCPDSLAPAPEP